MSYFQNRLDGGVSNRLELDRIQANRERTAASIPDIERQIAVTENAISLLLGRPPAPITREPVALDVALPPPIPPGLPASLLERRPDVVQAEQLLVAANADIGAAKALFYPTISLTGFFGGVSGDLTQFLGGDGAVWSLGAGLLQPVFQGGRIRRNLEAMQARFDAAVAEYQKAALNGYREVANSLVTIQKLAEVRGHQQIGVTALQEASDLARARYDSGLASYLEILTADERLFAEQLLLAQTRGAEFRARAELYRAWAGDGSRSTRINDGEDKDKNKKLKNKKYLKELTRLQGKLCVLQEWVKAKGLRVIVIFEGRDAAGKGGTIKAITERVSPRVFRLVALPAPSDREKSQMYLQRYIAHFPAAGEIVIFDRSWYNRAGVEHVMGFCTDEQYKRFLKLCPVFEQYIDRRRASS